MKLLLAFLVGLNFFIAVNANAGAEPCENYYCKEVLKYRSDYQYEWVIVLRGRYTDVRHSGGYDTEKECRNALALVKARERCEHY